MGFFDFLPCCRSTEDTKGHDEPADTDPLLPQTESITSQEGYGAVSMSATDSGGLSGKQRQRIAEIGREVGNHMLPINQASRAATTSPSVRHPSTARPPSPDSSSSPSRPTTPSPAGGADDALSPTDGDDDGHSTIATRSGAATPTSTVPDADGVVHKQLFHSAGGNPKRGSNGRGKKGARGGGRGGRGRGRSKKSK